jgi:two-component system LytT family response regulator
MSLQNLPPSPKTNFRVDTLRKIHPLTLMYLQSDANYTNLIYGYQTKVVIARSLKRFTTLPQLSHYLRVHRSFLVNPKYIKEISIWNAQIILSNGDILPISRRQIAVVQKFMDNL